MIFYIILLIFCNYSNGEIITFDEQLSKINDEMKYIMNCENDINNRLNKIRNEINIQKKNLEKLLQKKLDAFAIEQQNTIDKYNKLFGKKMQTNLNDIKQLRPGHTDYIVFICVCISSMVLLNRLANALMRTSTMKNTRTK